MVVLVVVLLWDRRGVVPPERSSLPEDRFHVPILVTQGPSGDAGAYVDAGSDRSIGFLASGAHIDEILSQDFSAPRPGSDDSGLLDLPGVLVAVAFGAVVFRTRSGRDQQVDEPRVAAAA